MLFAPVAFQYKTSRMKGNYKLLSGILLGIGLNFIVCSFWYIRHQPNLIKPLFEDHLKYVVTPVPLQNNRPHITHMKNMANAHIACQLNRNKKNMVNTTFYTTFGLCKIQLINKPL